MSKVLKKLFSRRRRGSVALLAAATMIPISGMLAASINTGQMVEDRRHTQDAADALAAMHGTWSARSMNVISMNSVSTAQLLTVAIGSEALNGALWEQRIFAGLALAHIAGHAGRECQSRFPYDPWPAICIPWHVAVGVPAGIAIARSISIDTEYDPGHGIDVARKALDAIEGMNRAVIERFPRAMREIGVDYADELSIDTFHFADPCGSSLAQNCETGRSRDGMALPVKEGGFSARAAFCLAMQTGTTTRSTTFFSRGFPLGSGPMRYGGSSSTPNVKEHINSDTEVGEMLHDFKDFYDSNWSDLPRYWFSGFTDHPDYANLPGDQEEDGPNSFTRRYDGKFGIMCAAGNLGEIDLSIMAGLLPILETRVPTFWELEGIDPLTSLLPPVQADEMPDEYRILAFGLKEKSSRLGNAVFAARNEPHIGYAQMGLYNPDGADIFSQNWRATLMPATRMESPNQVGQGLDTRAPTDFADFADVLTGIGNTSGWERIHAH